MKALITCLFLLGFGASRAQDVADLTEFASGVIKAIAMDGKVESHLPDDDKLIKISQELLIGSTPQDIKDGISKSVSNIKQQFDSLDFKVADMYLTRLEYHITKLEETVFADFMLTLNSNGASYLVHIKNAALLESDWKLTNHLYVTQADFLDKDYMCDCMDKLKMTDTELNQEELEAKKVCRDYTDFIEKEFSPAYLNYASEPLLECEDEDFDFDSDLLDLTEDIEENETLRQVLQELPLACECSQYILDSKLKAKRPCRKVKRKFRKLTKKMEASEKEAYLEALSTCE